MFPPKTNATYESIQAAAQQIAALSPSYMSVTYGAGGGTSDYTLALARDIQRKFTVPALAHLSCISSTRDGVKLQLEALRKAGIENILALRGDMGRAGPAEEARASRLAVASMQEGEELGA